ncbi:hypothetical protein UFOVP1229_50 [uncultured Caudovirales phage]|uniref:Uncharacterized protein n=1 Tax=uncultured Caudovirales phage TaxID=2100421 RepID=A0A6J5RDJ2_9CAUD|nr:hypothetical protein UFOVP1229_50 [uncultured Caudovirales phage]
MDGEIVETTAITAVREYSEVRISDPRTMLMNMPVAEMAIAQEEYDARRKQFRDWIKAKLVPGVHYGFAPGCEPKLNDNGELLMWSQGGNKVIPKDSWSAKPSLYKAGAEFVCDLMNLLPVYTPDKSAWEMLGSPAGTFVMRCQLYPKGSTHVPENMLGEGLGCRSVGDKKGDANNAIKMAQKSAMVCAVLNSYGLSDLFTQDIEDGGVGREPAKNPPARPAPRVAPRTAASRPVNGLATVNERFQNLKARWKDATLSDGDTPTPDLWRQWVVSHTELPPDASLKPEMWTPADLKAAEDAMLKIEGLPH